MFSLRRMSLRTKIIAWSFVPTAIILAMVALVTFTAYQQVTQDLVIERDQELTRLSTGQLTAELAEYAELLATEARAAGIYRGDAGAQQIALRRAHNRLVVFDGGVIILDTYGIVAAADPERPEIIGEDWSDRPYYRDIIRFPQPVFSNILPDGPGGAEVVVVAVPVTGEQGELVGVMAGMFRVGATTISALYGDIVKLRIGISGNAYLVDQYGRVIYHSDPSLIGSDFSSQPVVQQVLDGQSGAVRTRDLGGRDIVASFAPVPGTPWSLVTQENWQTLISSSQGYQRFLLLLLALGLILPAVVVAVAVRRITQPIAELIKAAQEVAEGSFGRTIRLQTGDEIEELAAQFNRMSAQLQGSYANLEQRVADRTRELASLNAIAQTVSQSLKLDDMMAATLEKVLEVLEFDAGIVYLRDSKSGVLEEIRRQGFSEISVSGETGDPLSREAAQTGVPLVGGDSSPVRNRWSGLAAEGFRATVSIPLIAKGEVVGVLTIASRKAEPPNRHDSDFLLSIGRQIGVAVENALLYEQAQHAAMLEERQRLARELHDAVTQTLFSASLIAEVLPRLWERDIEVGRERLEELRQLTRGALAEMRTLLLELRPAVLAEADLDDLLRQLAESATGRARTPVAVDIHKHRPLPPDTKIVMYRIAQEALNNVVKHANASQATVRLTDDADGLALEIVDDGGGFDLAQVPSDHLGLTIMRERAASAGAILRIESQIGAGTRIKVIWKEEPVGERL